ncbi:MAG: hypothetical protein HOP33_10460 [Verrucomicrobia bacterium]|nr:hypothetical protein [Verrucomicrobiota bacterium]
MIPREILKKNRQIELRPNRIVTDSVERGCARIPTGFRPKAQGCEERATLGYRPQCGFNRNAVAALPFSCAARGICHNAVGVENNLTPFTQGSACVATRGCMPESRGDSPADAILAAASARADATFIITIPARLWQTT